MTLSRGGCEGAFVDGEDEVGREKSTATGNASRRGTIVNLWDCIQNIFGESFDVPNSTQSAHPASPCS